MSDKKKSIWTPANVVTTIRVVFVPIWLAAAELFGASDGKSLSGTALFAALFYIVLSLTDKLDGYLARSRNEVTTFGKFLDPIADKLVVIVSLCFLLEHGAVSAWVLLIIVAREFLVSGLRMVVASEGTVIAASNLGKWKTATTMVSISGLLLCRALPAGAFHAGLLGLSNVLLLIAVVLTAWSGIDYFVKSWKFIADAD
jgi:CDP-diacylglycerol--glycerol-3-phosphate 3-phosphatidyltransferase